MKRPRHMNEADNSAVLRSLESIQAAQLIVNSAAHRLCSIPGFVEEWQLVCKLNETMKAARQQVEERRAKLYGGPRAAREKGGEA